jgi:hypothetical protein
MHLRNPELYVCALLGFSGVAVPARNLMMRALLTAVKFLGWLLLDWDAFYSPTYERRLGKAED